MTSPDRVVPLAVLAGVAAVVGYGAGSALLDGYVLASLGALAAAGWLLVDCRASEWPLGALTALVVGAMAWALLLPLVMLMMASGRAPTWGVGGAAGLLVAFALAHLSEQRGRGLLPSFVGWLMALGALPLLAARLVPDFAGHQVTRELLRW